MGLIGAALSLVSLFVAALCGRARCPTVVGTTHVFSIRFVRGLFSGHLVFFLCWGRGLLARLKAIAGKRRLTDPRCSTGTSDRFFTTFKATGAKFLTGHSQHSLNDISTPSVPAERQHPAALDHARRSIRLLRMKKIRVAIAGAGIGFDHLEGYLAHPSMFEVVAVCDPHDDRAEPMIARSGCEHLHSYEDALSREDIDLLDICLPPAIHKQAILDALDAGKHVVCEKPLAASLADVDEIIAAANQSNCLVVPVFQYRFGNGIGQLLKIIERGLAGNPLVATLETHWRRDADYYDQHWRGTWATELGGAIVGDAIHAHDLLSQVLGPIASVQANLATRANAIEVDDCGAIAMQMANGALATSSITLGHSSNESRLRFCFEKLSAESAKGVAPFNPGASPWTFIATDPKDQPTIDEVVNRYNEHQEGFPRQLELVHATLTEDAPPPVTLSDARASLALITAIYQSNSEGRRVYINDTIDHDWYRGWVPAAHS